MRNESFAVGTMRDIHLPKTLNEDVELIYVVEGRCEVRLAGRSYLAEKEDVVLINPAMQRSISSQGPSICLYLHLNQQMITQLTHNTESLFFCNSCVEKNRSYKELRRLLNELVYTELFSGYHTKSYVYSLVYQLVDELAGHYSLRQQSGASAASESDNARLRCIIRYVSENYQNAVSLSELAEQMYVSTSTLSRFFHRQTGLYFTDYVNQVRLKNAVTTMLHSTSNMTKIAMECGFSSPSAFNKIFRKQYGVSPLEYRASLRKEHDATLGMSRQELREQLKDQVLPQEVRLADKTITVETSLQDARHYDKPLQGAVNIGEMHRLTQANVQQHVLMLTRKAGFPYVRIWSLFSKAMMITDGKTLGQYNYAIADMVLDFLAEHGIRPYLDFGSRTTTIVVSPDKRLFEQDTSIEFVSRRAWEAAFHDFVRHCMYRYGAEEVSRWIFEISQPAMDDRPYYCDADYDLFNVFSFAWQTVRDLVPGAQVGGLASIVEKDPDGQERFWRHCVESGCQPDFVSFLLFPYAYTRKEGKGSFYLTPFPHFEAEQIRKMRGILRRAGLEDTRLYIAEWNNTLSNRNFLNDSRFRATYLLDRLAQVGGSVDMLCPWLGSDAIASYYDAIGVLIGAGGLITNNGIRKPAYFALQFANRLGEEVIAQGEQYIVTRDAYAYKILCWNFVWYSAQYFTRAESAADLQEITGGLDVDHQLELEFRLEDFLGDRDYYVKKETISEHCGSVLDVWKRLGFSPSLDYSEIRYLSDTCVPQIDIEIVSAVDNKLHIHSTLTRHSFQLSTVYPKRKPTQ